jgi:hypothetical protein
MREAAKDLAKMTASPDAAELVAEVRRTALRIDALRRKLMSET